MRDASRTIQERIASTHVENFDVDVDAMAVIQNIFRVAVLFRHHAEKQFLAPRELSFSGFTLLWVVWAFGKMETHELARECGISKGTLTGVLKTLEKLELAKREPHPTDGRRKLVGLTPRGKRLMKRMFPRINELEREFISGLDADEVSTLNRLLRIMLHSTGSPA